MAAIAAIELNLVSALFPQEIVSSVIRLLNTPSLVKQVRAFVPDRSLVLVQALVHAPLAWFHVTAQAGNVLATGGDQYWIELDVLFDLEKVEAEFVAA